MDLHRLLGADHLPLHLPASGLSLSRPLGESLGVQAGDEVDLEVLESHRRNVRVPVAALVDDFLGIAAYMDATELSHLMGETPRANVVLLAVDPLDVDEVTQRLSDLPAVSSISRPSVDRGLVRAEDGDVLVVMQVILALFSAAIAVGVVLLAALLSTLVVRSQSDRLDLVAVLKARD